MVEAFATLTAYLVIALTLGPIWAVGLFVVRVLVGRLTPPQSPYPLFVVQLVIYLLAVLGAKEWTTPVFYFFTVLFAFALVWPFMKVFGRA